MPLCSRSILTRLTRPPRSNELPELPGVGRIFAQNFPKPETLVKPCGFSIGPKTDDSEASAGFLQEVPNENRASRFAPISSSPC